MQHANRRSAASCATVVSRCTTWSSTAWDIRAEGVFHCGASPFFMSMLTTYHQRARYCIKLIDMSNSVLIHIEPLCAPGDVLLHDILLGWLLLLITPTLFHNFTSVLFSNFLLFSAHSCRRHSTISIHSGKTKALGHNSRREQHV